MKCALEIAVAIEVRKEAERIAEEERRRKIFEEKMEKFKANIKKIDAYVEKALVASENGCVMLNYGNRFENYCDDEDFVHFTKKVKYRPNDNRWYWEEDEVTPEFHLGVYIKYLEEHCFKVEKIEQPYYAYSSTGRSEQKKRGRMLKISI